MAAKIVGEPAHFSWAGLVSTSLAAGVASQIGPTEQQIQAGQVAAPAWRVGAAALTQGLIQRETSLVLGDNHVASLQDIGEVAVGSYAGAAVGLSINRQIASVQMQDQLTARTNRDIAAEEAGLNGDINRGTSQLIAAQTADAYGQLDGTLNAQLGNYGMLAVGVPGTSFGMPASAAYAGLDIERPDTSLNRYLVDPGTQQYWGSGQSHATEGDFYASGHLSLSDPEKSSNSIDFSKFPRLPSRSLPPITGIPDQGIDVGMPDVDFVVDNDTSIATSFVGHVDEFTGESVAPTINPYSLMTMGNGVGEVDWAGQPTRAGEPSNFNLGEKFSDIWESDSSLLTRLAQTAKLANYQVPDADARWEARQEAERVAQQQTARLDNMLNPAFALPWVAAHIGGASDEQADRVGMTSAVLVGVVGSGVAAKAGANNLKVNGGLPAIESYAPATALAGETSTFAPGVSWPMVPWTARGSEGALSGRGSLVPTGLLGNVAGSSVGDMAPLQLGGVTQSQNTGSLTRAIVQGNAGLHGLSVNQLAALRAAGLSDVEIGMQIEKLGDVQLFRGTTSGYPGNPVLQQLGITPASTDPLAATVFALESRAHGGEAYVYNGNMRDFAGGDIDIGNVRSSLEREVQVNLLPAQFQSQARHAIPVNIARQALSEMGIVDLPLIIGSTQKATQILETTPRLTPAQIQEFLLRTNQHH